MLLILVVVMDGFAFVLEDYADKVTLAEPSDQQLELAADYLKDQSGN